MVAHNKLQLTGVTGIDFGNFTAFLTIICHQKSNYFFLLVRSQQCKFQLPLQSREVYRYR
jgi:hypothetical protein